MDIAPNRGIPFDELLKGKARAKGFSLDRKDKGASKHSRKSETSIGKIWNAKT